MYRNKEKNMKNQSAQEEVLHKQELYMSNNMYKKQV